MHFNSSCLDLGSHRALYSSLPARQLRIAAVVTDTAMEVKRAISRHPRADEIGTMRYTGL